MKKRIITLCLVIMILGCVAVLAACSGEGNPYNGLVDDAYGVLVRFETGDAVVNGQQEITLVEVYDASQTVTVGGKTGVKLLAPDDPARGDDKVTISKNDGTSNYFLAGWYTQRQPRVDEQGNPLDRFGQLTSESGREQGYVYSGKWDFSTDVVEIDPAKTYTTAEDSLVLYAAWIPYFTYEFYTVDEAGKATLTGSAQAIDLALPSWSESTGKLSMNNFPTRENMTFEAAYFDAALTQPIEGGIDGDVQLVDKQTGVCTTHVVKIYTTWMEGVWYKVYNAKQFKDNMLMNGNYILCADLDFSNVLWPIAYTTGVFTGSIQGNGHTIKNVTVTQGNTSQERGGLFGSLGAGASLTDVSFENITYTLGAGSIKFGASFGTLCGVLSEEAALENVTVSSSRFLVGDDCYPSDSYTLGLLCGTGNNTRLDLSGITCAPENPETAKIILDVNPETGSVELSFAG